MKDFTIDVATRLNEQIRKQDWIKRKVNEESVYHDYPKSWTVVPDTIVRVKTKVTAWGLLMALRP